MLHHHLRYLFILIVLIFSITCNSTKTEKIIGESVTSPDAKPSTFKKIAPLTSNALGARKNLNDNGWLFIPPASKTIEEVIESGKMSSKVAKAILFTKMKKRTEELPPSMKSTMVEINKNASSFRGSGTEISKEILATTYKITLMEWELSKELNGKAANKFITGYVELNDREEEDRAQLLKVWTSLNKERSEFTGNTNDLFIDTMWKNQNKLTNAWRDSYKKSTQAFLDEYEESSQKGNSLFAMWDIFQGYSIALKEILISPLFNTGSAVGETLVINGVFVPVSHLSTFSGQAIMTTGMVAYYPVKLGYRIVSPTLEAGLLGTMGLASLSATAPTAVTGTGLSAFNQVTTIAAGYSGEAVVQTGGATYETTAYATGLVYDFASGSAESGVYALKSGLILSYTALTVIPAHLLLSVPDGTIFLAYDGPRVVIAVVRGNYAGLDDLPTGTIIDLEEAKKSGKVEILSRDQTLVKKVIDAEVKERTNNNLKKNTESKK
ncbi:MAG: hypothetical protein SH817_08755 [Leptospira sp.]|nr:hypothetical protein [Leptospira sp.]